MPEPVSRTPCTVTGTSGMVVIHTPSNGAIALSPTRAVEISNMLLEAAALANGQPAWNRS